MCYGARAVLSRIVLLCVASASLATGCGDDAAPADERALHDANADSLLFSSVAHHTGHAGDLRDANIEVTGFALATGHRTRVVLGNVPTRGVGDDHNAAAHRSARFAFLAVICRWPCSDGPAQFLF